MAEKSMLSVIPDDVVVSKIYEIRGQKVMLDSDLAELYDVETKVLNQAIKRNADRFPEDFMFALTETEWGFLRSQIVTSKKGRGGRTYIPNVFTERGILILSSVLNSPRAIQVNIQLVRIFIRLRQLINEHIELKLELEDIKKKLNNHDKNMEMVFSYLDELMEKKMSPRTRIGFKPDEL